jgi:ribosome-binding protein aMBF1 (putative translation factor)
MATTELPDLDAIRERIAELSAEKRAKAIPYSEVKRSRRTKRPQTERTKAKLSETSRQWRRRQALEDENAHPLRVARVNFNGDGLSQKQLAERALVAVNVIAAAERGEPISDLSAKRLARALRTSRTALGLL